MPFTIDYNRLLLAHERGTAIVHLKDGHDLPILSGQYTVGPRDPRRGRVMHLRRFLVKFGDLSNELQAEVQAGVNAEQRIIRNRTPEYRIVTPKGGLRRSEALSHLPLPRPRRIPLEKPPATFELGSEDTLILLPHKTPNGKPGLELGEKLFAKAHKPHDKTKYYLGAITGFTLT